MCGITGAINLQAVEPLSEELLRGMLALIQHRGPDEFGAYLDDRAALGSARLSIIDLSSGQQPICNEDGSLWIVFNGEIFNYVELRPELERLGHNFSTNSDTEVILHLYEEWGPDCLRFLNGQFAIAIWDVRHRRAFFARDRLGVRPLFYTIHAGRLYFGSEIKSLLLAPGFNPRISPSSLRQVLTYWSVQSPRTIFEEIYELPPAHWLVVENGQVQIQRYWSLDYAVPESDCTENELQEEFEQLLVDAVNIRLRADVPVGAYLSGGLDSSTTTALIRKHVPNRLETFSIAFSDPNFDESPHQQRMAEYLGTEHHIIRCSHAEIGRALPDVIWHTETPLLRTAPVPMFLLSSLVRQTGFKVVVTGEGADEFLAGYDIFKEMTVRRFWARDPESSLRPRLLGKLYPDIARLGRSNETYRTAFYRRGLTDTESPWYSHLIRWNNTGRLTRFLESQGDESPDEVVHLPQDYPSWPPLGQAQYLEVATFLSPYLLSSQGDRVAMAHSVEGRFPFLDTRLVEFCNRLPPHLKLNGMLEKYLLRKVAAPLLPPEIWKRVKRPYRAPIQHSFFQPEPMEYVREMLSPSAVREAGLFKPAMVEGLVHKAASDCALTEVEEMGLVGILSTQLVADQFIHSFRQRSTRLPESRPYKCINKRKGA